MGGTKSLLGFGGLPPEVAHATFHELSAEDSKGDTIQFSQYAGCVCLVCNVASK
jgi:hypothetical protein